MENVNGLAGFNENVIQSAVGILTVCGRFKRNDKNNINQNMHFFVCFVLFTVVASGKTHINLTCFKWNVADILKKYI